MSAAVPEMLFLHCPDDVEPGLVVFLVTVLDGGGGAVDTVGALRINRSLSHHCSGIRISKKSLLQTRE